MQFDEAGPRSSEGIGEGYQDRVLFGGKHMPGMRMQGSGSSPFLGGVGWNLLN